MAKVSTQGYKKNSPDKNESSLIIPSGRVTMKGVPHKVLATDNFGNQLIMVPGAEYQFPGEMVHEVPLKKKGGLTPNKAREILHDKSVHGHPLTDKQRRFFGAKSKGNTMHYQAGGGINSLEAANAEAKRFALSRGMMTGENAYVDKIPQYIDATTGKQYIPPPPAKPLPLTVPQGVSIDDIQTDGTHYWYTDPHSSDLVPINPGAIRSTQLRKGKAPEMKKGGIHIKPENRGKFTEYKKRTGKTTEEALHSKDPHVRKMAQFAKNARKWKHQEGGLHSNVWDMMKNQKVDTISSGEPHPEKLYKTIKPPKNNDNNFLPELNLLNMGLSKWAQMLREKQDLEYQKQMQVLQSQPNIQYLTKEEQYGNPMAYQIGGIIPEDISYMAPTTEPLPEMPRPAPSPKTVPLPDSPSKRALSNVASGVGSSVAMSPELQGYADKANKYLKTKFPKADISGEMLAQGAAHAYQRFGKVVPVELALAQLQIEGYLAQGKGNKPQRTKNAFNVGNTDDGATKTFNTVQDGINVYYNLVAGSYLNKKTPEQLLENYTNSKGQRYASAKNYEQELKKVIGNMHFKKGGEYDVTDEQLEYLKASGYDFEKLD